MKTLLLSVAIFIAAICFSGCNHHDRTKAVFVSDTTVIIKDCNCYCPEHPEAEAHPAHPEHPINPNHPVHPH